MNAKQKKFEEKKKLVKAFLKNYIDESMSQMLEQIEAVCAGGKFKNKQERRLYAEALRDIFELPYCEDDEW